MPAGDLVHVPFYEMQMSIGGGPLAISVEACSGRAYPERMLPGMWGGRDTGSLTTAVMGFIVMLLEAIFIPPVWLAAAVVTVSAVALYWSIVGSG